MSYRKKTNETIYKGQEAYARIDTELLNQTGEIKIIGDPILADEVITKVNRSGFEITYLAYFCNLFEQLGGRKYQVFKYIIENKNSDNQLIITNRELAEKTKTSTKTVSETLKLLREKNLINTRVGSIMLLPKVAHRGSERKEAYLMRKFETFNENELQ